MTLRRPLPLAVTAIIVLTAVPVAVRSIPVPFRLSAAVFDVSDFVANVLLYMPLGIALRGSNAALVTAGAGAAAAVIELLQTWYVGRTPAALDIVANAGGALLGLWFGRIAFEPASRLRIPRAAAIPLLAGAMIIQGTWLWPRTSSAIDGWDSEFPLLIGNEATGDRPWDGVIEELALVAETLPVARIEELARAATGEIVRSLASPETLSIRDPEVAHGRGDAVWPVHDVQAFAESTRRRQAFTIIGRMRSAGDTQSGPARIVTFSRDPYQRNFMIGQEHRSLVFRVRTPASGANGMRPEAVARDAVRAGRSTVVAATYDGAIARIYVDGVLAARANLAAAGCVVRAPCESGLPWLGAALGALLTAGVLLLARPATSLSHWSAVAAAVVIGLAGVGGAGLARTAPEFWGSLPAVVMLGAAATGWSLQSGADKTAKAFDGQTNNRAARGFRSFAMRGRPIRRGRMFAPVHPAARSDHRQVQADPE